MIKELFSSPEKLPRGKMLLLGLFALVINMVLVKLGYYIHNSGIQGYSVWVSFGFLYAFVLLMGHRSLLIILPVHFISEVFITPMGLHFNKMGFYIAFLSTGSLFLQAVIGLGLLKRFECERIFLKDLRSTFIYIVVAILIAMIDSAVKLTIFWGINHATVVSLVTLFVKGWLADGISLLVITSVIMSFYTKPIQKFSIVGIFETVSITVLFILLAQLIFTVEMQVELIGTIPFIIIPVLMWMAFRYSIRETTIILSLVILAVTYITKLGIGPFVTTNAIAPLLELQVYIIVVGIISLILSVAVYERKNIKAENYEMQENLENRVKRRTDELESLNKELLIEVNHRKKIEASLKESEERNEALLSSLPDVIFLNDKYGTYLDCRVADEQQYDIDAHALLNKTVNEVLPQDVAAKIMPSINEVIEKHKTQSLEYSMMENGEERFYEARISPCGNERVLSLVRDITAKKHAENQKLQLEEQVRHAQKLESLGVLAGGIAHDFNNLLTSIIGNVGLAMMQCDNDPKLEGKLQNIEQVSMRAADLCKQLLAYSGKGKFIIKAIAINELVKEMSELLEVSISKKVSFVYKFPEEKYIFEADVTQIRQIVMNLITNASEAIGDNKGTITLRTGAVECDADYFNDYYTADNMKPGIYTFLEIEDTGEGMDEETQSKIFDPFFTTKFTGRGLGLAAVLGIVRGHHGAIKIISQKGKGATFRVLFPIQKQVAFVEPESVPERLPQKNSGTILLVDDDENIRKIGQELLEKAGFNVVIAIDGKHAIEQYTAHRNDVDLVLMDLTMPELSGEEAFEALKTINNNVKVILSSGYSQHDSAQKFEERGLYGFLQKPYNPGLLISTIKDALEKTMA